MVLSIGRNGFYERKTRSNRSRQRKVTNILISLFDFAKQVMMQESMLSIHPTFVLIRSFFIWFAYFVSSIWLVLF